MRKDRTLSPSEGEPVVVNGNAPRAIRVLSELLPELRPAERKVAEFLIRNAADAIKLSVTDVADGAGSSEATVVRVCKKAGFVGYQEFKIRLAQDLVAPIKAIHEEINADDSLSAVIQKVFHANIVALEETQRGLSPDKVAQAVQYIEQAGQVLLIGAGNSGLVAMDGAQRMLRLGARVEAETSGHGQAVRAALLAEGDVVIAISHSGTSRDVLEAVEIARKQGARIILVTNRPRSPLGRISDLVLSTEARETAFRTEAMSARVAMLTILDTLFVAVGLKRYEQTVDNIQRVRSATSVKRL